MNAETFNALHPVGTPVFAYPGFRPEDASDAHRLVTRTRTKAQLSASGDPVVWVEGEGSYICLTHVDPVPENVWEEARAAEKPAEPEVAPTLARLTPEREAEIAARTDAATPGPWCTDAWEIYQGTEYQPGLSMWIGETCRGNTTCEQDRADAAFVAAAREDVPALLAELAAVRAERDQAQAELTKYVGKEPTIAEEMEYLSRCLDAVRDLCDATEKQATRWESPLPVPEWVEQVRAATDGARPDDPNDRRRRIYIDGKGRAWIDAGVDSGGLRWIAPIDGSAMEATREAITAETGSLREIGRCW